MAIVTHAGGDMKIFRVGRGYLNSAQINGINTGVHGETRWEFACLMRKTSRKVLLPRG